MPYVLLAVLLIANVLIVVRDIRHYEQFKLLQDTTARQKFLRQWVFEPFLMYGVVAVACLFALGRLDCLVHFPNELIGVSEWIYSQLEGDGFLSGVVSGLALTLVPMMLVGFTAIALIQVYSQHKTNKEIDAVPQSGDSRQIQALLPRNKDERFWTTLVSINAGLSEELYFRVLLPILVIAVTGNAWVAIAISLLWFGLLHAYQGWLGILVTALVGSLLMFLYLYTQSIWLVVLLHAIIDLNALTFAPWFAEYLEAKSSA